MNKKTLFLTKAAVTAALYAVFTLIGAALGISYGSVQLRFSEALCVLPLFSSAAVPGLALGCLAANVFSTVSPFDMLFGSLATLLAATASRALRNVKIKNWPFCSLLMPVIFNGAAVGAETAFFAPGKSFFAAFGVNFLTVAAGEAAVVFTLGAFLYFAIEKNGRLTKLIIDN